MPRKTFREGPNSSYYPESEIKEAAKYLRLIVGRFLKGDASLSEVQRAIKILNEALEQPGEKRDE